MLADQSTELVEQLERICESDREDMYRVMCRACVEFAVTCQGPARIVEMMIEALQAGLEAVRLPSRQHQEPS